MALIDELRANDTAGLWNNDDMFVNYSSAFLPLDYANGFWQMVKQSDGSYKNVPVVGIIGGTVITIIGETGSGKSQFAQQLAAEIIRKFVDGVVDIVDAEKTVMFQRVLQVTKFSPDDGRIILTKAKTSIEDTLDRVDKLCTLKESHKKEFMYDVIDRTIDGKIRKAYVPSVIIIDSLPSFNSKNANVDDLGNNMDGAKGAKDVSRFFSNILDRMWHYNITIICVNHIRPALNADPYAQPPRGLFMMNSKTEMLPRGSISQYYSHTFFRLKAIKSNSYTLEDNGFTGFKGIIQLAKTKTNVVGTSFPIAFISGIGFDPIYTLYEFASELKLIQGRNPYLYLQGMDDIKFNRKDFRNKMISDEDFRVRFISGLAPYLEALLGSKDADPRDQIVESALFDNIDALYSVA